MKKMKKFLALLIALAMVLGMGTSVFAEDSGYTITVNGAQKAGVYTAYKIFNATITANGDIAYTVEKNSDLEALLRGENSVGKSAFLEVFNIIDNGGLIYVTEKGTADNIVDWMDDYAETYAIGDPTTVPNTDGDPSITLDVGANGYYYITSTVGTKSAVMLTSAKPTATINDKIPTEPTTPDNAKKIKIDDKEVDVTTLDLGTEVTFNVTINSVNYVTENGKSKIVYQYKVVDSPSGFAIDEDSVQVTLSEGEYNGTIEASVEDNVLTVIIPWADGTGTEDDPYVAKYITPNVITVSYTATLTKVTDAYNDADIFYNDGTNPFGEGEDHVYSYTVNVNKVDNSDTTKQLPGAEFALMNSEGLYYCYTAAVEESGTVGEDNYVAAAPATVTWVEDIADATTKWTSKTGGQEGTEYVPVVFEGLAAGDYTLVEVTAPKGYNLAPNQPVKCSPVTEKLEEDTTLFIEATVKDETGSVLPSTGGIGTTIFYIVGGILVVGAGVVLITRRRMDVQ